LPLPLHSSQVRFLKLAGLAGAAFTPESFAAYIAQNFRQGGGGFNPAGAMPGQGGGFGQRGPDPFAPR